MAICASITAWVSLKKTPVPVLRFTGAVNSPDGEPIRVPGMGQGLYIARQIFEAHGGSITIKTSTSQGTAVYMSLPLTAPVGMQIPYLQADMEGETMPLPDRLIDDDVELDYVEQPRQKSDENE
jgi:hypothetical protein